MDVDHFMCLLDVWISVECLNVFELQVAEKKQYRYLTKRLNDTISVEDTSSKKLLASGGFSLRLSERKYCRKYLLSR